MAIPSKSIAPKVVLPVKRPKLSHLVIVVVAVIIGGCVVIVGDGIASFSLTVHHTSYLFNNRLLVVAMIVAVAVVIVACFLLAAWDVGKQIQVDGHSRL